MMSRVVIQIDDMRATIERGTWTCDDENMQRVLNNFIPDDVGYTPDADLTIALMVCSEFDFELLEDESTLDTFDSDKDY